MSKLVLILLCVSAVGAFLACVCVVLTVWYLPVYLQREHRRQLPTTAFAPVMLASTEHIDMAQHVYESIDGEPCHPHDRVLLKNQNDMRENGIWIIPVCSGQPWIRSFDLRLREQLVDGATIFVHGGVTNGSKTFVLRTMTRRGAPGTADIYFLTISDHLFGNGNRTEVNHMGLAVSLSPESTIPTNIHFLYDFWSKKNKQGSKQYKADMESIAAWTTQNPQYIVRIWRPRDCSEFVRTFFPKMVGWYKSMHKQPILQVNCMRWLILYIEGGFMCDVDTKMVQNKNLHTLVQEWKNPQMVIGVESIVSMHESEMINMLPIRHAIPMEPNTRRMSVAFLGMRKKHPFVHFMLQHIRTSQQIMGKTEYDIAFVSGADALTHVYAEYGADFLTDVHVLSRLSEFVEHSHARTWRTRRLRRHQLLTNMNDEESVLDQIEYSVD